METIEKSPIWCEFNKNKVFFRQSPLIIFGDNKYEGNIIVYGPRFSKYEAFLKNCFDILPRQALHAKTLEFVHPISKEVMRFDSELPEDITKVIEKWERYT